MWAYQDSTTFLVHGQMVHTSSKYFWIHSDLLMISHFVKIMDRLKIIRWRNTPKPISHKNSFGVNVKISQFHHIPGSWTHSAYFSKIFWFHSDLLMIFHFVKIMDRWELFNQKKTKNTLRWWDFVGANTEIWYKKYGG